jgi:hypothetical protein
MKNIEIKQEIVNGKIVELTDNEIKKLQEKRESQQF